MPRIYLLLLSLLLILIAVVTHAQDEDDCPSIARFALEQTGSVCEGTGHNQVCYGHVDINVETVEGVPELQFNNSGDVIDLEVVQSLKLSPMIEADGVWGVALMRLQADIPDTIPGQMVSVLMFGDVSLFNDKGDNQLPGEDNLQAFYFHTGIGDSQCEEAPNSGLLVRTSGGVGEIHFMLNDVKFELGSVAFLQAAPGDEMHINLLSGIARVQAFGEERVLRESMRVRVPIDDELRANGPPSPVEKCATNDLVGIPDVAWNCDEIQVVLDPRFCPGSIDIPQGMVVILHMGSGYATESAALIQLAEGKTSISIDGIEVDVYRFGVYEADGRWAFGTNHDWGQPAPGTYLIEGVEPNATRTCQVNIVAPAE